MRVMAIRLLVCLLATTVLVGLAVAGTDEDKKLREAVRAYFAAEMACDHAKVWEMLAPSSKFKRMYSYPFYEEFVRSNPIRVKSYTIEEVVDIYDNPDRKTMPHVDKIGVVRVHVVLSAKGGVDTEHTSTFTFLKEEGKWLKG
ncbi:MAG: nuclear transport factor 2 family protein [Deltaproteobacteria bacterium]